jgi:cyclic dehypoxanthinyl futalosine synthase
MPASGSFEYLKTLAISRLMLDNIPNFQSSWVTQGPKIGQLSLKFGANDMGGTMIEENVVSQAGTIYCMPMEEIERLVVELGYVPKQRNFFYEIIN